MNSANGRHHIKRNLFLLAGRHEAVRMLAASRILDIASFCHGNRDNALLQVVGSYLSVDVVVQSRRLVSIIYAVDTHRFASARKWVRKSGRRQRPECSDSTMRGFLQCVCVWGGGYRFNMDNYAFMFLHSTLIFVSTKFWRKEKLGITKLCVTFNC
jgi:hypothetical protein